MENVIVLGSRERYQIYMPDFVAGLPIRVSYFPTTTPWQEIAAAVPDAVAMAADAITPVPGEFIRALPNLKMIHSDGVGFNAIDVKAAAEQGVYVCNCKGCNADAVAESTVMLMLMVTRFAVPGYRAVVEGRQMAYKQHIMSADVPEFADHAIGLVGLGDIATATAKRLAPFGNKLYYYAPHRRSPEVEAALNVTYLPLEEMAAACDILSLHCAVTPETTEMVNDALLARMKPGSYLINTSRGQLVDNDAVRRALISGHLAGAGFDTLYPEPTPGDHPLVALPQEVRDRVAYAPHLGGNTGPAFRRAYLCIWENIRRVVEQQRPTNVVNGL